MGPQVARACRKQTFSDEGVEGVERRTAAAVLTRLNGPVAPTLLLLRMLTLAPTSRESAVTGWRPHACALGLQEAELDVGAEPRLKEQTRIEAFLDAWKWLSQEERGT